MFYFPTPYEDEILYSIIARYCLQSGNLKNIYSIEDIFNNRNIVASPELPGNLNILVSNLPINSVYTSEYFIFKSTLFPYISSFLSKEKAKEIQGIMKEGQVSFIYNKSGFVSGNITQNRNFKFCPECMKEDIQKYGEMYWHRVHQVTGVYICPIHKVPIYDSIVQLRGNYRQSYIPATTKVCKIVNTTPYTNDIFEKLTWISEDIQNILNRTFTYQSIKKQKYLYMKKLIEKKLANLNSMVHQKELRKSMVEFWGKEVLDMLESPIDEEHECSWLSIIVRDNDFFSQPLRNLIVMRFLGININELLDYGTNINEVKSHKQIWEEKLKELANRQTSLREMAIILDSTRETVKKHIIKLGIEPYWDSPDIKSEVYVDNKNFIEKQEKARRDWLCLQDKTPSLSRNKLRKLNETLYNWLVKYDKEWLYSHSFKNSYKSKSSYWIEKDKELLYKVKKVVNEMIDGKPVMIQWSTIGGKLGVNGIFAKNRDRIPMVKEYIDLHVECLQDFHIRKIRWALKELEREGKSITKWNLLEKAGVKPNYLKAIQKEVSEILRINGYDENLLL